MVFRESDVFAGVEQVNGDGVTQYMRVATVRWQRRLGRIAAEEVLDLPLLQAALATDEECLFSVLSTREILLEQR